LFTFSVISKEEEQREVKSGKVVKEDTFALPPRKNENKWGSKK
jgi:hypothetical protein